MLMPVITGTGWMICPISAGVDVSGLNTESCDNDSPAIEYSPAPGPAPAATPHPAPLPTAEHKAEVILFIIH